MKKLIKNTTLIITGLVVGVVVGRHQRKVKAYNLTAPF